MMMFKIIIFSMLMALSSLFSLEDVNKCQWSGKWYQSTRKKIGGEITWKLKEVTDCCQAKFSITGSSSEAYGESKLSGSCFNEECKIVQHYIKGKLKGRKVEYIGKYNQKEFIKKNEIKNLAGQWGKLGRRKVGYFEITKRVCEIKKKIYPIIPKLVYFAAKKAIPASIKNRKLELFSPNQKLKTYLPLLRGYTNIVVEESSNSLSGSLAYHFSISEKIKTMKDIKKTFKPIAQLYNGTKLFGEEVVNISTHCREKEETNASLIKGMPLVYCTSSNNLGTIDFEMTLFVPAQYKGKKMIRLSSKAIIKLSWRRAR